MHPWCGLLRAFKHSDESLLLHKGKKLALVITLHRSKRQAKIVIAIAHSADGSLYGNGIYLAEQSVYKRQKP